MLFKILTQLKTLKLSLSTVLFLTQHLGLSTFYSNLGSNNPVLYRVYEFILNMHLTKTFD